jgi:MFS family permease
MPDTIVFIPAWNEEDNLPAVLDELRGGLPDVDVLVVDDGSTDRTAAIAAEHGAQVLSFGENRGLRAGIAAGYRYAHEHGYAFADTPLWAGIYILPLTVGMLFAGPISGYLSDRFGARPFASGGMLGAAISFALLALLPIDFPYPLFALVLAFNGISMGMFASPNRAGVMNSLPRRDRGAGGGMNQTFQNSAQVASVGIFFTLMIAGLTATLPAAVASGLRAHGVDAGIAAHAAHLPAISVLFAAFLGYNPTQHLLGAHVLAHLSAHNRALLMGRGFFPHLIAAPFKTGLHETFVFAIVACLLAAAASLLRGGRYHFADQPSQPDHGGHNEQTAALTPGSQAVP